MDDENARRLPSPATSYNRPVAMALASIPLPCTVVGLAVALGSFGGGGEQLAQARRRHRPRLGATVADKRGLHRWERLLPRCVEPLVQGLFFDLDLDRIHRRRAGGFGHRGDAAQTCHAVGIGANLDQPAAQRVLSDDPRLVNVINPLAVRGDRNEVVPPRIRTFEGAVEHVHERGSIHHVAHLDVKIWLQRSRELDESPNQCLRPGGKTHISFAASGGIQDAQRQQLPNVGQFSGACHRQALIALTVPFWPELIAKARAELSRQAF
mmetsp:Transcript_17503/g.54276  ORF Transcript_17503/g.54276 Transcript_17503/m.54276 type:complete len:267 (+) Transcript_17503:146-946(+)